MLRAIFEIVIAFGGASASGIIYKKYPRTGTVVLFISTLLVIFSFRSAAIDCWNFFQDYPKLAFPVAGSLLVILYFFANRATQDQKTTEQAHAIVSAATAIVATIFLSLAVAGIIGVQTFFPSLRTDLASVESRIGQTGSNDTAREMTTPDNPTVSLPKSVEPKPPNPGRKENSATLEDQSIPTPVNSTTTLPKTDEQKPAKLEDQLKLIKPEENAKPKASEFGQEAVPPRRDQIKGQNEPLPDRPIAPALTQSPEVQAPPRSANQPPTETKPPSQSPASKDVPAKATINSSLDSCKKNLDTDIASQKTIRLAMQFGDQCAYGKARTEGMSALKDKFKECFSRPEMQEIRFNVDFEIDKAVAVLNENNCNSVEPKYRQAYLRLADRALERAIRKPVQKIGNWTLEYRPPTNIKGTLQIADNSHISGLELTCGSQPGESRIRPVVKVPRLDSLTLVTDKTSNLRIQYGYFDRESQLTLLPEIFDMRMINRKIGTSGDFSPVDFAGAFDLSSQIFLLCRKQNAWGKEDGYLSPATTARD